MSHRNWRSIDGAEKRNNLHDISSDRTLNGAIIIGFIVMVIAVAGANDNTATWLERQLGRATMNNVTSFMNAFANVIEALQWPIILLIFVYFFRHDVRKLLARMVEAELFGAKGRFGQDLVELERRTGEIKPLSWNEGDESSRHVSREVLATPFPSPSEPMVIEEAASGPTGSDLTVHTKAETSLKPSRNGGSEPEPRPKRTAPLGPDTRPAAGERVVDEYESWQRFQRAETRVLSLAAESPRAGLLLLSSEIEQSIVRLFREFHLHLDLPRATSSVPRMLNVLQGINILDGSMVDAIKTFWNIQNRIVHGEEGADSEIIRAVNSGLEIYQALLEVERRNFSGLDRDYAARLFSAASQISRARRPKARKHDTSI